MSDHDQVKMTQMNYDVKRPKAENPLKVMDLSLRDGHQSLFATRGRTEDMIPVAELMDQVGFWAVETWGGATFDTMHRFLNEDPWERIRTLKRRFAAARALAAASSTMALVAALATTPTAAVDAPMIPVPPTTIPGVAVTETALSSGLSISTSETRPRSYATPPLMMLSGVSGNSWRWKV